jgi:hypothetical protein
MSAARASSGRYVAHFVLQPQLAVLGQQQRARAGELLGHRADREHRVLVDRRAVLERTLAVPAREHHLAVAHDRQRQPDEAFASTCARTYASIAATSKRSGRGTLTAATDSPPSSGRGAGVQANRRPDRPNTMLSRMPPRYAGAAHRDKSDHAGSTDERRDARDVRSPTCRRPRAPPDPDAC